MSSTMANFLIFILGQHASLMKLLTGNTVTRPGHGLESLLRDRQATANTFAIATVIHAYQRFVDQVEHLPIII